MHNVKVYHQAYYTCSAAHVAGHMSLSSSMQLCKLDIKFLHNASVQWLQMLRQMFDLLVYDNMVVSTQKQAQPVWSQHS